MTDTAHDLANEVPDAPEELPGGDVGVPDPGGADPSNGDPGLMDPGPADPGAPEVPGDPGGTDAGPADPGRDDAQRPDGTPVDPGSVDPGMPDPGATDPGAGDPVGSGPDLPDAAEPDIPLDPCAGLPPCGPGLHCVDGACTCDPADCPGCCDGDACLAGTADGACGSGGLACLPCPPREACQDGRCAGCGVANCAAGCCSGPFCVVPSGVACGIDGQACRACGDAGDGCADGACTCGGGAPCGDGQRCVEGACRCDAASCPDGCCDGDACLASAWGHCGLGGVACDPCAAADRCVDGACRCGEDDPCAAGQRCVFASCACDGISCAGGCCDGTTCVLPATAEACGRNGWACEACDPVLADGCVEGACGCGPEDACVAGQRCAEGACVCDRESCPDGCCRNGGCVAPARFDACGAAGAECGFCDSVLADACADGACRCGEGPACSRGARCVDGQCLCNAETCWDGCCDGGTCRTGLSWPECGGGGRACQVCDPLRSTGCNVGWCVCGSFVQCAAGQECVGTTCACTAASCPDGCCRNGACIAPGLAHCGLGGATCRDCTLTGDSCGADGACTCGDGPACDDGMHCVEGACVCDAVGCADGCCDADGTCRPKSMAACGHAGSACRDCPADRSSGCSSLGECLCGASGACEEGRQCLWWAGVCACTASSCPDGCCGVDGHCTPASFDTCGIEGTSCRACPVGLADACVDGTCRCGDDGECLAGQRCVGGACVCDAASCPDGCCGNGLCYTGQIWACGAGGGACVDCGYRDTDRCVDGACRCGLGPECPDGQRCTEGECRCDNVSCPSGCCVDGACVPRSLDRCGTGDCAPCDLRSDRCDSYGRCVCGTGWGPCSAGQQCLPGTQCSCTDASCPDGCCWDDQCVDSTFEHCGTGTACVTCDEGADACTGGACTCGGGPACGDGQRCVDGACACDATSCPDGCCDGLVCRIGEATACGTGGGACTACGPLANACVDGQCRCGTGSPCVDGQVCESGTCRCTAFSCPDGCCSGQTCYESNVFHCGTLGRACQACGMRGDGCSEDGACTCGGNPGCLEGQQCLADGTCACNTTSCFQGCCDEDGRCRHSVDACGALAGACTDCGVGADSCSTWGQCLCGTGAACGGGLTCFNGACVCPAGLYYCPANGGSCVASCGGCAIAPRNCDATRQCVSSCWNQCGRFVRCPVTLNCVSSCVMGCHMPNIYACPSGGDYQCQSSVCP